MVYLSQNNMNSIIDNFSIDENGTIAAIKSKKFSIFNNTNNLHFIGLGGSGSNVVEYLQANSIKAKFTCITNPDRPNLSAEINFINFRAKYTDIQSIDLLNEIANIFNKNENYILLNGLGGNSGTFLTKKIAELLFDKGISFIIISSLPFSFEGTECPTIANLAMQKLQKYSNFYFYTFNEVKILYNKKMGFRELFVKVNEMIYTLIIANRN